MKKLLSLFLAAAFAISAADAPRVSRVMMLKVEKNLDDRLMRMWSENPTGLVGASRGVYLPGYGVVITAEVNLATANISMMNPTITEADKIALKKQKLERIPQLKKTLRELAAATAIALDTVPPADKVTIALILPRYSWEDPAAMPLQVVVEGTRQQLMDAHKGGIAALDQVAKISESN
ncbi:MAG: hypothetical protein ABIR70_06700 [Bryobacteraceae bacterium]